MKKGIYVSKSCDPYLNQSIEHFLFQELTEYDWILMLYINEPSVVIGRNQNPWKEVQFSAEEHIKVVRRISGGGTVYHDLGNLNYSFIYNRNKSSTSKNFEVVLKAVDKLGINLNVTERKDLFYGDRKVSGNAFYNKGNRIMHHGTLLVDLDTSDLWKILNFEHDKFIAKGVDSVKSPIVNLASISNISMSELIKSLKDEFESDEIVEGIARKIDMERFSSWQWIYGETPKFNYIGNDNLLVDKGKVVEINGHVCESIKFDDYVLKEVKNVSRIV